MKKRTKWILRVVLAIGVTYSLDFLSALAGVPSRPRYATITINRFFFVNEKFNKFSYSPIPSLEEKCVNALLPHFDARPCWYVKRHTTQTIDID